MALSEGRWMQTSLLSTRRNKEEERRGLERGRLGRGLLQVGNEVWWGRGGGGGW